MKMLSATTRILLGICSVLCGMNATANEPAQLPKTVHKLDLQIQSNQQQAETVNDQLTSIRKQATGIQLELLNTTETLESLRADVKSLQTEAEKQRDAAAATLKQLLSAEAEYKAAQQELEAAQMKFAAAEKTLQAKRKEHQQAKKLATTAAARMEQEIPVLREKKEPLKTALITLQESLEKRDQQIKQHETQLAKLNQARTGLTDQIQNELEQADLWISFREQIAPIFHARCLACHNQRTAQGAYNMANFSAIMGGGESGSAIVPGDADSSLLYLMMEDGSMPKDADPVPADQLQLIKDWINRGARFDRQTDNAAPLIRIMPRPSQPRPPTTYPAPLAVTALQFSPTGETVVTSGYHEVLVWSTTDQQLRLRIDNVAERVYDLQFHSNERWLAVAAGTPGRFGEAKLFDVDSGKLVRDFLASDAAVFAARFSPDGKQLATAGADRSIRIFDVESGQEQLCIQDHADWIVDLAWSPDANRLVSASRDKTAKLFDAQTGRLLLTFNDHGKPVTTVRFLPDGKSVISAGEDRRLRIWDSQSGKQIRKIEKFGGPITSFTLTDAEHVDVVTADGILRRHRLSDGKQVLKHATGQSWPNQITHHAASNAVAIGSLDGELQLRPLGSDELTATWSASPPPATPKP